MYSEESSDSERESFHYNPNHCPKKYSRREDNEYSYYDSSQSKMSQEFMEDKSEVKIEQFEEKNEDFLIESDFSAKLKCKDKPLYSYSQKLELGK